jgi:Ca2+-transporting ATPase
MQILTSYHTIDIHTVLDHLETTQQGIHESEAVIRNQTYGPNIFESGKRHGLVDTFFAQFASPLIGILIFASCITAYLNEFVEFTVIWFAILLNVILSTYQEYKAENTIEQLKKLVKNTALVIRAGIEQEIPVEQVTIGDIVVLQYGSRVPADVRLIDVTQLALDETILTGESLPVTKQIDIVTDGLITNRTNYAFCGTLVVNGSGIGVVTHIGSTTEIGRIAQSITNTKRVLTPVQNAVNTISWYIFVIALCIVSFVFVLGVYRGEPILDMLILASAIAVGAVPEALPITLTVILAIGVLSISRKGGLVRKLSAAETLGSTTLVLTDKTGTLTEGVLTLDAIHIYDGSRLILSKEFDIQTLSGREREILVQASRNFTVRVIKKGDDYKHWIFNGNAFEVILVRIMEQVQVRRSNNARLVVPFNSTNKYSVSESDGVYTILGAPDILIQHSVLTDSEQESLLSELTRLSNQGKRMVALAEKDIGEEFTLDGIRLIGLFEFSDTLRKNIREHIVDIQSKGVKVKIISGDLPGTALYIGSQVGILAGPSQVLTGSQLASLSDDDLITLLPDIQIFARVTPEDKLRIGKLYQRLGEIVAMTGDGVNDSPSLKAMDIGISLSSGSEVAKSASDMILMRDDFKTIVATISVGHTIKSNIQKVFVYLMSTSLDEVFVVAGSLIAGIALPLNALQIIWVNILTGTLPAIAFAYDRDTGNVSTKGPIFNSSIKWLSLGIGALSSLLLFVLYYWLTDYIPDIRVAQSVFFLCFSLYILVVAFSFKNLDKYIWEYNPFSNKRLNSSVVLGIVLLIATSYSAIGQQIFGLVPMQNQYLWIVVFWILINIWVIEFAKFVLFKVRKQG